MVGDIDLEVFVVRNLAGDFVPEGLTMDQELIIDLLDKGSIFMAVEVLGDLIDI